MMSCSLGKSEAQMQSATDPRGSESYEPLKPGTVITGAQSNEQQEAHFRTAALEHLPPTKEERLENRELAQQ